MIRPDQQEEFITLWKTGEMSVADMAARYGTYPNALYRLARHLDLPPRPKRTWKHGNDAYNKKKCRCDICTAAHRDAQVRHNARRRAEPKDPNDPRHGTVSFYANHGCRCEACSEAHRVRYRRWWTNRKT